MRTDLKLTDAITIKATPAEVWNALTNKEMIKQYFWGTEAHSDWKEGSAIRFVGSWEGTTYEDGGTILKLEKEKTLQYNYWTSFWGEETSADKRSLITYEILKKSDSETELQVTQQGFKDKQSHEHSIESWKEVLSAIKKLVEKKENLVS